jgi:hypothetical protein
MQSISSLSLNRIASFMTPIEVNNTAKAFRHDPQISAKFLQSLMRLTIFCSEYGEFPKGITWKENATKPYTMKDVCYVCTNFQQIEKKIQQEFQMDCRYKAVIYKVVSGRRVVLKKFKNCK